MTEAKRQRDMVLLGRKHGMHQDGVAFVNNDGRWKCLLAQSLVDIKRLT